jgi:hypothetical protein
MQSRRSSLPFRLNPPQLVQALRDGAPEDALSPFKEALERLGAAKPAFDEVINSLRLAS